jgi:hypothetical protein
MRIFEPLNTVDDTVPSWRSHVMGEAGGTVCGIQVDGQYQTSEIVFNSIDGHDVRSCFDCDEESESRISDSDATGHK